MIMFYRVVGILFRIAILGLPAWLFFQNELLLACIALILTMPFWWVLLHEIRPLEPNWRPGLISRRFNHSRHQFTLNFRDPVNDLTLEDLYTRLRTFDEFNGKTNWVARRRFLTKNDKIYVFFETRGLFGFLSALINPPLVAVRIWSDRASRRIIGDTADGHMLIGQRRWQISYTDNAQDGVYEVVVSTEAYELPRGPFNRIGQYWIGSERQLEVWTAYFDNMRLCYADSVTSSKVRPYPAILDVLPPCLPPEPEWHAKDYPGVEI